MTDNPTHAASDTRSRIREMTIAALIASLTAASAWITVPFGAVPVTLQTTFVILAALLLSPGWAAASMALYVALGAVGLPVFAGGAGGMGAILGPTGGFLLAFPVAALTASAVYRMGAAARRGPAWRDVAVVIAAVLVAEFAMYAMGLSWLSQQTRMTLGKAVAVAFVPFVVPDVLKAMIAVTAAAAIKRATARP